MQISGFDLRFFSVISVNSCSTGFSCISGTTAKGRTRQSSFGSTFRMFRSSNPSFVALVEAQSPSAFATSTTQPVPGRENEIKKWRFLAAAGRNGRNHREVRTLTKQAPSKKFFNNLLRAVFGFWRSVIQCKHAEHKMQCGQMPIPRIVAHRTSAGPPPRTSPKPHFAENCRGQRTISTGTRDLIPGPRGYSGIFRNLPLRGIASFRLATLRKQLGLPRHRTASDQPALENQSRKGAEGRCDPARGKRSRDNARKRPTRRIGLNNQGQGARF